jgi:ABC-type metal ion transport system substrate-binding protein
MKNWLCLASLADTATISAGPKKGQGNAGITDMRVIATSNDPVRISFLLVLLQDAGIECILLDSHVSAVEGSIGAIPRRLMVAEDDAAQARRVLREAGEA